MLPKVYFHCNKPREPSQASYHHGFVGLIEGLKQLQIPVYANRNYWQYYPHPSSDTVEYLVSHNKNIGPDDCDIVVLDSEWSYYNEKLPAEIKLKNRPYTLVYIDLSDGSLSQGFDRKIRHFDIVLKASYNIFAKGYPSNMRPWFYGGNNRIIETLSGAPPWEKRTNTLLYNFRCPHEIREMAEKNVYGIFSESNYTIDNSTDSFEVPTSEKEKLFWIQTGRRHNLKYYEKLHKAKILSCFGGFFIYRRLSILKGHLLFPIVINKIYPRILKLNEKIFKNRNTVAMQWDSFRLWESFLAGIVTLHIDFKKYGLCLPHMPENEVHYLGVDFDNLQRLRDILHDDKKLQSIAENGKKWAEKYYTGTGIAKQFLQATGHAIQNK